MTAVWSLLSAAITAVVLGAPELAMFLALGALAALYAAAPSAPAIDARRRNRGHVR